MAVAFWCSIEIFVILTLSRASNAHFDDLIERVRMSKSNDPEVQDFLRSVLNHRADFRWIQGEASRFHREDQILPLRGVPYKNKRAFYSSLTDYPPYANYGYRMSPKPDQFHIDRPMNDAYPYEEEARKIYNKRNVFDEDDFLDNYKRKKRDLEYSRYDTPVERILNEKLKLHNLLRKGGTRMNAKDFDQNMIVDVIADGEKGEVDVPGNKYEFKTLAKRQCAEDPNEHDIKIGNDTLENPLGEFYYSNPHDILGMSQDIQNEPTSPNKSCIKYKKNVRQIRSLNLDGLLNPKKKKTGKTIKIKIFDDGRLVKNIKKDDDTNSIVLTIKNDATTREPQLPTGDLSNRYILELNRYSDRINTPRITYDTIKDDDTLQKIDTILRNDEATLKLSAQIPVQLKQKSSQSISDIVRDNSFHERSRKQTRSNHLNSDDEPDSFAYRPEPITNSNGNSPQISTNNAAAKLKENYNNNHNIKKQIEENVPTVQNRLEDQTEPTSAAEQRELGKINNNFQESTPMADVVSTEKMIIIPFKKRTDEEVLDTEDDVDVAKKLKMHKFHVKDSKDMIHSLRNKKNVDTASHVDIKLRDSEEVLDKLKYDLEHTIKQNLINKEGKPVDKRVAFREENSDKANVKRNIKDFKLKHDLLNFLETDEENTDISDDEANEILDNLSDNKRKKREFNDLNFMSSQHFNDFLDSLAEKENIAEPFVEDYDLEDTGRERRSFNSRTLKSFNLSHGRRERSLQDLLGMTNDEDYSEDKIDDYDGDFKRKRSENHRKINSKFKLKSKKNKFKKNNSKKQKSEVAEKENKDGNKDKSKKKKNYKVKKDVEEVERLEEKLNLFTNNLDLLKKSDGKIEEKRDDKEDLNKTAITREVRRTSIFKDVKKDQNSNNLLQKDDESSKQDDDYTKRMDETSKQNEDVSSKEEVADENVDAENARQAEEPMGKAEDFEDHEDEERLNKPMGNELDIIEKTQAILLHITNPPSDCSTSRGEYDDSDDMSSIDGKNINHRDEGGLKVKHQRVFNLVDNAGDDVVGEIMRIVNNYKEKSLRSNKKSKEKIREDEEDVNLANQNGKEHKERLHPANINLKTCHQRPGTDHNYHQKHVEDSVFIAPKVAKEGFTDLDYSKSNTKHEDEESFNIKRDLRNDENPMQFTPDSFESFKDVIEEKPDSIKGEVNIRIDTNGDREKRYLKNLKKVKYKKRMKRYVDEDDEEFENLLSPLQPKQRFRRYQNMYYNPYLYNNFLRYKLETNGSDEVTTQASTEAAANITTLAPGGNDTHVNETTTIANANANATETCPEDMTTHAHDKPFGKENLSHEEKKKNKKNKKKMKDECLDDETYDLRHKVDEYKDETEREKQNRLRNREKLKNERTENRQKEKERIKTILNGHMITDVLVNFENKLKENGHLFERFGNSIGKQCIKDQVTVIDKRRDEQSKKDIKHAQLMLHQVIVMLNKIVADQVHRRTCLALPPILENFLATLSTPHLTTKSKQISEGYPLPQIQGKNGDNKHGKPDEKQGDFLFDSDNGGGGGGSSSPNNEHTMKKKIILIKKLLNKYNNMSENCQIKVEPVKDYLMEHLSMLEKLSKEKKTETDDICTAAPGFEGNCTTASPGATTVSASKEAGNGTTHAAAGTTTTGSETTTVAAAAAAVTTTTAASVHDAPPAARSYYNFDYPDRFRFLNNDKKILSDRYRKLVEAADSYRRKRQIEKRLARLFGGRAGEDVGETREKKEVPDLRDIGFEAPIVYSLDD